MKEKLEHRMNGKICLVTGGTNGLGKATAQALVTARYYSISSGDLPPGSAVCTSGRAV